MFVHSFTLSLSRYTRNILVSCEFEFPAPIPSIERCSLVDRQPESSISVWTATRAIFRSVRIVLKKFIDGTITKRQRATVLRTPFKRPSTANKLMGVNYLFGKKSRTSIVRVARGNEMESFTKDRVDRSGLREIRFLRPVLVQRCSTRSTYGRRSWNRTWWSSSFGVKFRGAKPPSIVVSDRNLETGGIGGGVSGDVAGARAWRVSSSYETTRRAATTGK